MTESTAGESMAGKSTVEVDAEGAEDLTVEVTINNATCMASGNCAFWAPKTFDLHETENHSVVINPRGDPIEKILGAARGCPTQSIKVLVDGERMS
jgi:ferredoxin